MSELLKYTNAHERKHNLVSNSELDRLMSDALERFKAAGLNKERRAYWLAQIVNIRKERAYRENPYDLGPWCESYEGKAFPLTYEPDMVRCIHEGICPTCGRAFDKFEMESVGSRWDWDSMTGVCFAGHKHTAEPNESDNDWVAW